MIDFSAYPPLVEIGDVAELASFSESQLEAACEDVRGACGWHIAPRFTETFHIDSDGGTLLTLPSLLITEPESVTDADGNEINDFRWSQLGQLTREAGWPGGYRAVIVTVSHGLVDTPTAIVAVVVHMLASAAAQTPGAAPIKEVTHDGATIGYGTAPTVGPAVDLTATYGHVLRRYSL